MTVLGMVCRWGTPNGSRSIARDVYCDSVRDLERAAMGMLQESGEPRAFVTHHVVEGRAFRGYRQAPREYYGEGYA